MGGVILFCLKKHSLISLDCTSIYIFYHIYNHFKDVSREFDEFQVIHVQL